MPSLLVAFGQVVRRLRSEAGFSQESFADAIGVHRNYVGTVERGETNITLESLIRIARGLGQPMWMILREIESAQSATGPQAAKSRAPETYGGKVTPIQRAAAGAQVVERRNELRGQLVDLLEELGRLEKITDTRDRRSRKRGAKSR